MNFQLDLLGLFDPLKVVGSDSDLQCKHPKKTEKEKTPNLGCMMKMGQY